MKKRKSSEGPGRKKQKPSTPVTATHICLGVGPTLEMVKLLRATPVKKTVPTPAAISSYSSQLEMGACNPIRVPC